jgi:uncharacterized membrane protein
LETSRQPGARHSDEKETGRIEAFSDGVFGIAITLLILEIKIPQPADLAGKMSLGAALFRQWPAYISYLTSFLTILIMWMNHHRLFRHIRRSDDGFLVLNGLLLMAVTIVPFPTAVLSSWCCLSAARTGDADTAAAVYSGVFVVIAVLFNVLWRYAAHRGRLLATGHDEQEVAAISKQYRGGPLLYLVAFGLAFISVPASVGTCMALAVFFALPGRKNRKAHPR